MLRVRVVFSTLLSIASLCVVADELRSQGSIAQPEWKEVGGLGDATNHLGQQVYPDWFTAFYFFDATHGIAAITGASGQCRMYYIRNKFGRWDDVKMPGGFTTVRSIRLIQGNLYGATDGPDVIKSTDSGKTWAYARLGLANGNDVFADASGAIAVLHDPMKSFARLDTLHCVATGEGSIFVSSNGGLTWNSVVTGFDPASSGAFADRCQNVFLCPSSWGVVFRSTDFGVTWLSIPTGSGPGLEYLNGASTTAYIVSGPGMYRSTDDGLNWTSIITVSQGIDDFGKYTGVSDIRSHIPLFVFGPMGEHVIMPFTFVDSPIKPWIVTEPFITFTGGDDMLHSASAMTDSNGAPLQQQDTMNVPLQVMSHCNAFALPVPVLSDVEDLSVDVEIEKDSLGDFTLLDKAPKSLRIHHEDTLWLAYNPHHPVSNVTLRFDNHWHCSEWSELRTVHVVSIPTADISPLPVFGAMCMLDTEAAVLRLDSCMTLVLDSVGIPSHLKDRLQYIGTLPDTGRPGSIDSLRFVFNPPDTIASYFDSVVVYGHYLGLDYTFETYWYYPHASGIDTSFAFFHKTLPVRMSSRLQMVLLPQAASISLARPDFCDQALDTLVTLTNKGCAPDTIFTITVKGTGYSFGKPVSLPIIIKQGDSVLLPVQFVAPDTGNYAGTIEVTGSSGALKTITVPLAASGYPHQGILDVRAMSLQADAFTICGGDTIVIDTLWNHGCDTLNVSNIHIGDHQFDLLAPIGDTTILPQSWQTIRIRFHPHLKGRDSVSLTFDSRSARGGDTLRHNTVGLAGYGLDGTKYISSSIQSAEFDTIYTCEQRDTTILIANTGCDTLIVQAFHFSNPSFSSSAVLPMIVPPNSSVPVILHLAPDTTGHPIDIASGLTIATNSDNDSLYTIPLNVALFYPVDLSLTLERDTSAKGGSVVSFHLLLHGDRTNLSGLQFDLTHDDDLLSFDSTHADGLHQESVSMSGSDATRHFTLKPLPASDTVGTITFTTRLSRKGATPITISNVLLANNSGKAPSCIGALNEAGSNFTYLYTCGEDILQRMLNGKTITIDGITPNPARDDIEVHLRGIDDNVTSLQLSIYDVLGREVWHSDEAVRKEVGQSTRVLHASVNTLSEGVHYIRISTNEGRWTIGTRRIAIERD
jgi:hypothetical protein